MKKHEHENMHNPSAANISGQPQTVFDMLNKYGTYNIQLTSDNENEYPKIAQGLPEKGAKKAKKKPFGKK